jgi:FkbM family methyltransferase
MHSSPIKTVKSLLKKIPFIVQIKRQLTAFSYVGLRLIFKSLRFVLWEPLFRTELVKKLVFDTTETQGFLAANTAQEAFIVSTRDSTIGRMVYAQGVKDAENVAQVIKLLGPNHTKSLLIDVGANIGTVCIPAVKRGLFKSAVAIEPEPFNYSILKANIQLNGLDQRISTFNIALGAKSGEELVFELSESNYGDHRVRRSNELGLHGETSRSTIVVKSEPFDTICTELNKNDAVIWMDTQGYEGYILSGAKKALASSIPLIVEFWPYGMNRLSSFQLFKEAILGGQYTQFIDLGGMGVPEQLSSAKLDELYKKIGLNGGFTDLLITSS